MANNQILKDAIAAVIKENGNNEITGEIMQQALNSIINQFGVGSLFLGLANPTTNPGTPDQRVFYIAAQPGVYANFGGYELTGTKLIVLDNKTGVFVATVIIDLSKYFYPDYLKDNSLTYTGPEKTILNAIKVLDFEPVADEQSHDWIVLLVKANPANIIIRNLTAAANWELVLEEESFTDESGVKYYNGQIEYPYADAVFKYNIGVDWSKLPNDFSFDNNATNLHVKPGGFSQGLAILNGIEKSSLPKYLLDDDFLYSRVVRKVISAIPVFDIVVPNIYKNDDWRLHYVATDNPTAPLNASYKFSIEIRNLTTSKAYIIVQYNQPELVLAQLQGLKTYEGRFWSSDGTHYIDYNIRIDWALLGANFQYAPLAPSEIKLKIGDNNITSGIKPGFYGSPLRYPVSFLSGRTAVMYGTSIWALSYDMPAAIIKNGGNYKNEAISSGCYRSGVSTATPETKIPWPTMLRALGDTVADKVYILANWDSVYRNLASLNPPNRAYFDGQHEVEAIQRGITDAEFYISCSYERRILPYLDGTKPMPDVWYFGAPYNDAKPWLTYETPEQFIEQPVNPVDKNTFMGAMNFYIGLILQYNPYARIALVGHYENQLVPRISQGQIALANHWQIPLLKTWELTGFSQNRIPGTQHLNVDDPGRAAYAGVDGTDPTKDITCLQWWIPDNIHPATSAQAQNLLLDIQANWISKTY